MESFPFTQLSMELGLEIIRVAALPELEDTLTTRRLYYSTAIALCSVSHRIRLATMPHLLHTVILRSASDVLSFISSIVLQRDLRQASSRLALDYTKLVRRFWSTQCWEPVVPRNPLYAMSETPDNPLNYDPLYEVIRNVQSLGLTISSHHLLYNGLASANADPVVDWKCHRLAFAGHYWRWLPITSTPEGQAFLRQLTHLVLWIEDMRWIVDDQRPIPHWLKNVPFNLMPSLTHFAFTASSLNLLSLDAETCKSWILSENPGVRNALKDMEIRTIISDHRAITWELAFLQGENDEIWTKENTHAEDMSRSARI